MESSALGLRIRRAPGRTYTFVSSAATQRVDLAFVGDPTLSTPRRRVTHPSRRRSMATAPPDVLVILVDDMGFGASSAFGGPCSMPTAEQLAARGLSFTRFHSTGVCSPTRQSLLTGRNHHAVNMGTITDRATPVRGYTSVRPADCAPLAAVLSDAGYRTAAFGKWHQLPEWMHAPEAASQRSWPTGEGFDEFYGFIGADSDHYSPTLFHGTQPVDPPDDPHYHLSTDLVDRTADWFLRQGSLDPDAPRFAYLSFGATHAPHHAPPDFLERYRGRFDDGWDAHRQATLERQKSLGVIPEYAELTKRPEEIPAWVDVAPTILELAGVTPPVEFRGVTQRPLDGRSMAPSMAPDASEPLRPPQYFEVHGNRAVWFNGWWACAKHAVPWVPEKPSPFESDRWELYAPDDWSQARDLAQAHPEVLDQLKQLFEIEADRNHVKPLDDRRLERFLPSLAGRPTRFDGRVVRLDPSIDWLGEGAAPDVKNRSHRVIVELDLTAQDEPAEGVIIAPGGRF